MLKAIDDFVPGAFWTPERAATAVEAMTTAYDGVFQSYGRRPRDGVEPPQFDTRRVDPDAPLRLRRGRKDDVPALARLIASADLPALFIDDFVEGFVVGEQDGAVVACGGLEPYEGAGVLRSIVVGETLRKHGLGRRLTEMLVEEARQLGLRQLYLFTMDSWPFWEHLGFAEVPLDGWALPPRACWQYRYVAAHPDFFVRGLHTMVRSLA